MNETAFILGSMLAIGYYFYRVRRERASANQNGTPGTHEQKTHESNSIQRGKEK